MFRATLVLEVARVLLVNILGQAMELVDFIGIHFGDYDGADFLDFQRDDPSPFPAWQAYEPTPVSIAASTAATPEPYTLVSVRFDFAITAHQCRGRGFR